MIALTGAPTWRGSGRRHSGRLAVAGAFLLLLVVMFFVRNHYYLGPQGYVRVPALAISGDEPHYLVILNSILFDRDLNLREDYARVRNGGLEAGARFRGVNLDHHTFVVDDTTASHAYWREVYEPWSPLPCPPGDPDCVGFRRTSFGFPMSTAVREAAAHPVVFPALLAAAIIPRLARREDVEGYASDAIIVFCWLAIVIVYLFARRVGLGRAGALLTASLLITSPWMAYSRAYFADSTIGLFLLMAALALHAGKPVPAGIAAAVAAAMKPAFVGFGFIWAMERAWARRYRDAVTIAAITFASAGATAMFNFYYVRTLSAQPMGKGTLAQGLWATLLSGNYGLLSFAPWAAFAAVAAWWIADRRKGVDRTLLRQLLLPIVPYGLLIAWATAPGYGANCYGPRYYVAVMPLLALTVGIVARESGRAVRASVAVLALLAATLCIPAWIQYAFLWDKPATAAWHAFSPPPWKDARHGR